MDQRIRTQTSLMILAFVLIFLWGALVPLLFRGSFTFSARALSEFSTVTGAPPLRVGTSTFNFFFALGILLFLLFIYIAFNKSSRSITRRTSKYPNVIMDK